MAYDKILLLGAARGGTSLLSSALGAHTQIAMLDEDFSDTIKRITGGKIAANKLCVPYQIEMTRKWKPIYKLGRINGFLRKSLLVSKLPRGKFSIRDYDALGVIKHVCILRHPTGVIKSLETRERRKTKVSAYGWRRCLEIFKELQADPAYDPVFVSFEKLVENPEQTLKALCKNLEIPYEKKMLEAPARGVRYITDEGFQKSKAVYEGAEEMWKYFDPSVREMYEEISKQCL